MSIEITHSNCIGVVAANHTGYIDTMFNCMEAGNIAIPLRSADDFYRIKAASVGQVVVPTPSEGWVKRDFSAIETDAVALIAFTSGTEGSPKGVILTHNNLNDVVNRLNSLMCLDSSISEYIGVPVYHSFGFGRCRAVATVGGQSYIPSNGFNPAEIGAMLKNREINAISAVPSLWRVLIANKDLIGNYGSLVRWIEIGSQYMSRLEKEELKAIFPEARIVQHYGLTEASRSTLLEIHNLEGEALESVGQALGSVAIKITEEGRIAIRGHHIAQKYLIDGQEIALQDEDGWFVTKDLGSLESGYLYYKGRADDVINCGGIKVHPETLETKVYAEIGCSSGLAICRKTDPLRGESFLVAVTDKIQIDTDKIRKAVLKATQELGVNAANAITIIDVDSLPTTATGKIQRQKLADKYSLESFPDDQPIETTETSIDSGSPVKSIFCRILHTHEINPEDTFINLGGDSLSYVQVSMDLERYLGYLPRDWEQIPLVELEKLIPQRRLNTIIEMNTLLRALAISGVVMTHSGWYFWGGGAMLLFLIAGLNFSRFQGCALINGNIKSILPLLKHILPPYLIIAFTYQVYKGDFDPIVLLGLGNFQPVDVQINNNIFFVWFVACLVQTFILFSLIFYIPAIRSFSKISPWRFGFVCLIIGVIAHLIGPRLWDTTHLSDQVPHMLFWLFALGWCIHFSTSRFEKVVITALAIIAIPSFIGLNILTGWWLLIGSILLLWVPYIPIPVIVKTPIQMVSAASYYIYLTTLIFLSLADNVGNIESSLVKFFIALSGGVITWFSVQSLEQFISQKSINKLRVSDSIKY